MNPWSPRGFSNANCLSSGENTSAPTVPRIDSSRSGSRQSAVALARVWLHTLLWSSDAHAARRASCEGTAPAGGGAAACAAAALAPNTTPDTSAIAQRDRAPIRPPNKAPPLSAPVPSTGIGARYSGTAAVASTDLGSPADRPRSSSSNERGAVRNPRAASTLRRIDHRLRRAVRGRPHALFDPDGRP